MSALSKFDPRTDHLVTGFLRELPEIGAEMTFLIEGSKKREQVVGAWWTDEPLRDPAIGYRRHAAMITRTIEA